MGRRENAALNKPVAGGKDFPPHLRKQIITRTAGITLFIEEVTKSVLESGILREESDAYVLEGPLPVVAVPSSLQASLIARLDRIVPARVVVQTSAALGREFSYAVLKAVTLLPGIGVEALAQVEAAMTLLPKVSAESARQQLEGRLHVALGDALVMTKGFASPEVMSTLSRARQLLNETDHPIESLRALCGMFNYHLMRSESPACLDLTAQLLKRPLDRPTANVIHYLAGTAHLHRGNFRKTIHHLETALSLYEEDVCGSVA